MAAGDEFEMDAMLRILDAASGNYPQGSKEEEAIQLAAIALLYIRHIQKMDDFLAYHREYADPAFHVRIAQVFATQEDADAWLASGTAPDGALVRIAGRGFQVIHFPTGSKFLRTPLPDELGPPGAK